jgi:hypothetical protein
MVLPSRHEFKWSPRTRLQIRQRRRQPGEPGTAYVLRLPSPRLIQELVQGVEGVAEADESNVAI